MVSIIVPVYNAEKYLRQCLDSIQSQTYTDFEVILVDDGSTDCSGAICDEYAQKDKRFRVVHQKNGGVSVARNKGLDNAEGDSIVFIDSDDYIDSMFLQNLTKESPQSDWVIGGYETFPSKHKTVLNNESLLVDDISQFIIQYISQLSTTVPWGKLYKLELIRKFDLKFEESIRLSEDWIFNMSYLKYCKSVHIISESRYFYYEGVEYADQKYNLGVEELKHIIDTIIFKYKQLEKQFCFDHDLSCLNLGVLCSCYPLLRIYEYSDGEYFELCKKYLGFSSRDEFYSDLKCSPIHRTIYVLKNDYMHKRYRQGNSLMHLLSDTYCRISAPEQYPNAFQKILYYTIMKRYFGVSKILLHLYVWLKKNLQ